MSLPPLLPKASLIGSNIGPLASRIDHGRFYCGTVGFVAYRNDARSRYFHENVLGKNVNSHILQISIHFSQLHVGDWYMYANLILYDFL